MGSLQDCSDEILCGLSVAGDRLAEECLAARYGRLVRACARPLFLAGGDSEDLIQEGMIGLLSAIRTYSADRNAEFRTYAETCVRNRMHSAIRAAAGKRNTALNQSIPIPEEGVLPGEGQELDPEDVLISREELTGRMKELRDQLSGLEDRILDLYLNGLSYEEIGVLTGKPLKSVDNAIQRIRRKAWFIFNPGVLSES